MDIADLEDVTATTDVHIVHPPSLDHSIQHCPTHQINLNPRCIPLISFDGLQYLGEFANDLDLSWSKALHLKQGAQGFLRSAVSRRMQFCLEKS